MTRFSRYQLRTTEIAGARAFYAAVLGGDEAEIVALPAQAAAAGAPAHWLGHLGVSDVEAAAHAFVARGATRLGPPGEVALLRDPVGAIIALEPAGRAPAGPEVVWHQLSTPDLALAASVYAEICGFEVAARAEGPYGAHQPFAWQAGGEPVGWLFDSAGRPEIHPAWLFHFSVASLDTALAAVKAGGGLVVGSFELPRGERLAVCDDAQGAAFALRERGMR